MIQCLYVTRKNFCGKYLKLAFLPALFFNTFLSSFAQQVTLTATVTTKEITNITTTTADAGGNITADGGLPVLERGIVYGPTDNPTITNNKVVDAGIGTGSYTVTITGLIPATFYCVRAYAINAAGVSYGANVRLNTAAIPDAVVTSPKQMEYLSRGVVAVRSTSSKVYVGWRLLGLDPPNIAFNVYRDGLKLNTAPITNSTNYEDNTTANGSYTVKPIINGVEGAASTPVTVWAKNQLSIPLQLPAGGTTPDGKAYTYTANDASVGDVDGDGEYEIFLRWAPTVENHNSGGYSGKQLFDCYKLNGTRLWRIDLGINMNAGPHFNQFMVYDFDGDGKAEMILKTADGTIDGTGKVIGNAAIDYRNSAGWVQTGPEYLTVFNGLTGAAMATTNYEPARGNISDWGDNYGNRADRFVSAVAYLDGARPSIIVGRGYYDKLARAAYDWRDGKLTLRWKFDSKDPGDPNNNALSSQGNHQMTIGDVDGDGKDEIINGSSAINDDGKRLWTYGQGHGDALHMSDMDPDRPGQEIWQCLESPPQYTPYGLRINDAKTGAMIAGVQTTGDVGRALAADVDPNYRGFELWSSSGNMYNVKGEQISTTKPTGNSQAVNHAIWWDGDLGRELLDGTIIDKWNPTTKALNRLFTIYLAAPVSSNNDTKRNPALTTDLFGDWREEVILRRTDNTALIIFTTTIPTQYRIPTLMHDPQYRTAIAWQNSAYNQPPHPSYFLGYDMAAPPAANIVIKDVLPPAVTAISRQLPLSATTTNAATVTYRVHFSENVIGADVSDFSLTATGNAAGNIAAVNAAGAYVDVTVDQIAGDGTLRLDVKSAGTNISDEQSNPLAAGFTQGDVYTFDHSSPTATPVTISSNNAHPTFAKEGDEVTVSFSTSEKPRELVVTIAGQQVQLTTLATNQYRASYTMTGRDEEGVVKFTINVKDSVGNEGEIANITTDSSRVIYDRTPPLISAPANVTKNTDNGSCAATNIDIGMPQTSDNFQVASVIHNAPASFPRGINTITWTATDSAGNPATASQDVIITDAEAPVVSLVSNPAVTLSAGSYTLKESDVIFNKSDNCGIESTVVPAKTFTCANIGSNNPVTITVTDINSNVFTATVNVKVVGVTPAPLISVSRTNNTYTGVDKERIIFLGYGTQILNLNVTNSTSSSSNTTYLWGPATYLNASTGAMNTFVPTDGALGDNTIVLTATNEYGCVKTNNVVLTVVDARCGNGKVLICKKGSSAEMAAGENCVNSEAVSTHLANGSTLGACATPAITTVAAAVSKLTEIVLQDRKVKVHPTLTSGQLTVQLSNYNSSKATVLIMDLQGKVIARKDVANAGDMQTILFNISNNAKGMYVVKVLTANGTQIEKVVLQ